MRTVQIILFFTAILVFVISLFFTGRVTGDIMWRAGMAILLLDIVFIMLWKNKS